MGEKEKYSEKEASCDPGGKLRRALNRCKHKAGTKDGQNVNKRRTGKVRIVQRDAELVKDKDDGKARRELRRGRREAKIREKAGLI